MSQTQEGTAWPHPRGPSGRFRRREGSVSKRSTPAFWRNPPVRSHSAGEDTEAQRKGGSWSPVLAAGRRQGHAGSNCMPGRGLASLLSCLPDLCPGQEPPHP